MLTGVLDPRANRRDTRVSTSSLPVTTRFQPFMSSSTPRRSEGGSVARKSTADVSGIGDFVAVKFEGAKLLHRQLLIVQL